MGDHQSVRATEVGAEGWWGGGGGAAGLESPCLGLRLSAVFSGEQVRGEDG